MDIRNPKNVKQAAKASLNAASRDPRMLVLLHTAVALGAGLLVTVLNFILTRSIDSTGGLAGLQIRSMLSTAQSVLQLASSLLLPFWQIGLLWAALAFARQQTATPTTLLEGFRRFGPVLRLLLLRMVLLFAIGMVCVYAGSAIFMMTPLARPITDLLIPMVSDASMLSDPTALLDDATMQALSQAILPAIPIVAVLFAALAIPVLYRLRLSEFALLDTPKAGALAAFRDSLKLTRRNVFSLFRIDFSFWWFYLGNLLCLSVGYADLLLPLLGIPLPVSQDSAFFVCYIVSLFLQLALYWHSGAYVYTTQAVTYDALKQNQQQPAPQPAPQNLPWDYE